MKSIWRILAGIAILGLVVVILLQPAERPAGVPARTSGRVGPAVDDLPAPVLEGVTVSEPVTPTLTIAVRDLPEYVPGLPELGREMHRETDYDYQPLLFEPGPHENPLATLQRSVQPAAPNAFGTPILNFPGMDYGAYPPDTTGDVGPNHYIQAVNGAGYGSMVAIYNKSGTELARFAMESLAPTDSPCNQGYCDPIVLYDEMADRWVITEFSSGGSNAMCIYVSTSPDPLGTWQLYSFDLPYYDYPKYGVWGDAYYMGYNGGSSGMRQVFAFDRTRMLAGLSATYQMFSLAELSAFGFQLVLPAGLEGDTAPPAGSPGIFARPVDTEIHSGWSCSPEPCDLMDMWELHVDWTTPSSSALTHLPSVRIADFDHTLCGTGSDWSCMPQPGTGQALDPIREPIHFPLQYRNFETHETLVGCFAEDVDGSDRAAVHWFELRRTPPGSGSWTAYQEGVLDDALGVHRSVCSAAMDSSGNIAVGYTRTGSSVPYYPSIYYAGRLVDDPLGTMPYFEYVIINGVSSNTANERWGDYSGIGVDPSDGCTFWYTTEYMESGGTSDTRIAAFRFEECGSPDFGIDVTPGTLEICATSDAVYDVEISSRNSFTNPVTLSAAGSPGSASFSVNPVAPPAGGTINSTLTISGAAAGTHFFDVGGTSGLLAHSNALTLTVRAAQPAAPAMIAPANGAMGYSSTPSYSWSAVSGAATYEIQVATNPAFSDIVDQADGLAAPAYTSAITLTNDTIYYWRVRAVNACGQGEYAATWAFRTGAHGCRTYHSTDVPKTIEDNTTVWSTLTVPDSFVLDDVDVVANQILHTYDQDLEIVVRHPSNTQVDLSTNNGSSGNNYIGTIFDQEAATSITAGSAPFTGRFRPEGNLGTLYNRDSAGTWRLGVSDEYNGDTGTLDAWSLVLCGDPAVPADYSDLDVSYGVAMHGGDGAVRLGTNWSADDGFTPAGSDDSDDGVTLDPTTSWQEGAVVRVDVDVTAPSGTYYVAAWFDWNNDGDFADTGEQAIGQSVAAGSNAIQFTIPTGAGYTTERAVNCRFRLYTSEPARGLLGSEMAYGDATGGEVEDSCFHPSGIPVVAFLPLVLTE